MVALLGMELAVTVTGPVVTVLGATATICVLLQLTIDAADALLKLTVLAPCEEPKFEP
jgi:hypothetical protein